MGLRPGRATIAILMAALLCCAWTGRASATFIYTTLDGPLGAQGTYLTGMSNGIIAGGYWDPSHSQERGFRYDGSAYASIDYHDFSTLSANTDPYAISGNIIVGKYYATAFSFSTPHGFKYDGTGYTRIDHPLAGSLGTSAYGVDGAVIVGSYFDSSQFPVSHGFSYNGSTFT